MYNKYKDIVINKKVDYTTIVNKFLDLNYLDTLSIASKKGYKSVLKSSLKYFKNKDIFNKNVLYNYANYLYREKKLNTATVRKYFKVISCVLKIVKEVGFINENPIKSLDLSNYTKENKRERYLLALERKNIKDYCVKTNQQDLLDYIEFAIDKSSDASKIDLEQEPIKTVTEYKDGMQITFRVKNNSVDNMQVQLNSLGYKALNGVGIGSFLRDAIKTVMYSSSKGEFVCINSENTRLIHIDKEVVSDLNNVTEPCKLKIDPNGVKNVPTEVWGHFEVEGAGANDYIVQTYTSRNNDIYQRTRAGSQEWGPWRKLVTDYEFNQILGLSKEGTKDGVFKFALSKRALPAFKNLDEVYNSPTGLCQRNFTVTNGLQNAPFVYFSRPVVNFSLKNYAPELNIDTNIWFLVVLTGKNDGYWFYSEIWIGTALEGKTVWNYSINPYPSSGDGYWTTFVTSKYTPWTHYSSPGEWRPR